MNWEEVLQRKKETKGKKRQAAVGALGEMQEARILTY
jgi:hypothetical protein